MEVVFAFGEVVETLVEGRFAHCEVWWRVDAKGMVDVPVRTRRSRDKML